MLLKTLIPHSEVRYRDRKKKTSLKRKRWNQDVEFFLPNCWDHKTLWNLYKEKEQLRKINQIENERTTVRKSVVSSSSQLIRFSEKLTKVKVNAIFLVLIVGSISSSRWSLLGSSHSSALAIYSPMSLPLLQANK